MFDSRKFEEVLVFVQLLVQVDLHVVVVLHVDLHGFFEQSHLPPHFPAGSFGSIGSTGSIGLPSGQGFLYAYSHGTLVYRCVAFPLIKVSVLSSTENCVISAALVVYEKLSLSLPSPYHWYDPAHLPAVSYQAKVPSATMATRSLHLTGSPPSASHTPTSLSAVLSFGFSSLRPQLPMSRRQVKIKNCFINEYLPL